MFYQCFIPTVPYFYGYTRAVYLLPARAFEGSLSAAERRRW